MKNTIIRLSLLLATLLIVACGDGGESTSNQSIPAVAPALPASEVNNAAPDGPLSTTESFRLLEQTTFGPTLNDIHSVALTGPESWISAQMKLPASYMTPALQLGSSNRWNEYVNTWWRMAIQADDQLRQRVAFALSEIFVISASDGLGDEQLGLANYYDILLRNAFGNYRDLIEDITLNPVMGEYLSMKGNRKPDAEQNIRPDENYARELLQLFSIGLSQLNPDGSVKLDAEGVPVPTYDQNVVESFAHVFTGWHFANADDFRWPHNKDYISPMSAWVEYHDTGKKTLLNDEIIPAGQTAEQDLAMALDNVFNHVNVGPFISKQLIQRLVTSNPTAEYVRDVTAVFNKNAAGERGNLGSTIKAILMHREARSGHLDKPDRFGKAKEPLIRVAQLWRAFEPDLIQPDFNYGWVISELDQAPLNSPSVFNFFRPDFSQPGAIHDARLVSPEFQIFDESTMIALTNRLLANSLWSHNYKVSGDSHRLAININREMQLESDKDTLLDHLDLLLLGGRMSTGLREEARSLMEERNYPNAASQRVVEAIFLIITSPEAAIQI